MPRRVQRAVTKLIAALLLAGFVYAGRATAVRYVEIFQNPVDARPSASIDVHLEPTGIDGADQFRHEIAEAGWTTGEDVLVLAAASAITRQDLYQFYYAAGYLMHPARVWLAAWCDAAATAEQCTTLAAEDPDVVLARHGVRRVVLIGPDNPIPGSDVRSLSHKVALVTVR